MLDVDWKVHEVVLLDRRLLVVVQQRSLAVEDVVELLFGGIAYDGRGAIRPHRQFTVTGYAFQLVCLPVANAEYRLVYSRSGVRSQVIGLRLDVPDGPAQECRVGGKQAGRR